MVSIGLKFDTNLIQKYPEIMNSISCKNNNACSFCLYEFEDEREAQSLVCEHQFCKLCWSNFLIEKVNSEGLNCVF